MDGQKFDALNDKKKKMEDAYELQIKELEDQHRAEFRDLELQYDSKINSEVKKKFLTKTKMRPHSGSTQNRS